MVTETRICACALLLLLEQAKKSGIKHLTYDNLKLMQTYLFVKCKSNILRLKTLRENVKQWNGKLGEFST
jgi:hypothetical protein